MTASPKDWWKEFEDQRPGPSRIRVTLSRELSPAEKEYFREAFYGALKLRVADDSRIYAESFEVASRDLFAEIEMFVADEFVNVFPIAVRTFRELKHEVKEGPLGGLLTDIDKVFKTYSTFKGYKVERR